MLILSSLVIHSITTCMHNACIAYAGIQSQPNALQPLVTTLVLSLLNKFLASQQMPDEAWTAVKLHLTIAYVTFQYASNY